MNTNQIQEQINQLCTIIDDQQEQIEKLNTDHIDTQAQMLSLAQVLCDHELTTPADLDRNAIGKLAMIDQHKAARRDGLA